MNVRGRKLNLSFEGNARITERFEFRSFLFLIALNLLVLAKLGPELREPTPESVLPTDHKCTREVVDLLVSLEVLEHHGFHVLSPVADPLSRISYTSNNRS
jgi:hypothetical protein